MPIELIGAGFGRTGTLSLKLALAQLGLGPCYHMTELMGQPSTKGHVGIWTGAAKGEPVDWDALFADYRSTVDWPGAAFWRQLHAHSPQTPVLLSKRDGDRWYDSVMKTIWPSSKDLRQSDSAPLRAFGEMVHALVWEGTFDGRIEDRAWAISVFEKHNAEVEATIAADRLLVWEPGEGWDRLCNFLGVPVPDAEFPHANSSEDFGRTMGDNMQL